MIEPLITRIVQEAPAIDPELVAALRAELEANGAPLALAISRIVEYVAEGLVDPGVALPALAEACATLVSSRDPQALAAAHYQIDTLEPIPDVPVGSLTSRAPRRRT